MKCSFNDCNITPSYGYLGKKLSMCFTHKLENMVVKSRRKCIECTDFATHGITKPEYCKNHSNKYSINFIQKKCNNCSIINILNQKNLCRFCDPDEFNIVKLAKKNFLEKNNKNNKIKTQINNSEKYSLHNINNWCEIYNNSPSNRWKDMYKEYLNHDGVWNGICIRCKKKNSEHGLGWRWCNKCATEYYKKLKNYRNKSYKLLKNKTNYKCSITGCNKIEFINHIESKFDSNMNWENKSVYWQLDHIVPLSWFDIEREEELKYCCNYKNIQPLEKIKNMRGKNCRIE